MIALFPSLVLYSYVSAKDLLFKVSLFDHQTRARVIKYANSETMFAERTLYMRACRLTSRALLAHTCVAAAIAVEIVIYVDQPPDYPIGRLDFHLDQLVWMVRWVKQLRFKTYLSIEQFDWLGP